MKRIIAGLLLLATINGYSQSAADKVLVKYPELTYENVKDFTRFESILEIPGKTKTQLHAIVSKWVALSYKSGKAVTDMSDKESGEIIIKGRSGVDCWRVLGMMVNHDVSHTIAISLKDNKLRLVCEFETMYIPATSGTRIGTSYVSGSPASERSVASMINRPRSLSKKDKLIFTHSLHEEYLNFCQSLVNSINNSEMSNDW